MDKIVVILPVFNGIQYLKENIESVLNQTLNNFNFIILDDCSTDGSWEYLCSLKDERLTLLRNNVNKGLFFNLNKMIKSSEEPLIKLWAQDDIMYSDCLSEVVIFHEQYPEIGFSYSGRHPINENGIIDEKCLTIIDDTPEIVSRKLHTRIAFSYGSIAGNIANVTLNRKAVNKVGLFNESMKISGDFELWVRIARFFEIGFLNKPLIKLRNHKDQLSKQEEFYLSHIKEDIESYKILINYSDSKEVVLGRKLLRNYKLMFYFILLIKSLKKGDFSSFKQYVKILNDFDNIYLLTFLFLKSRIYHRKIKFN